MNRTDLEIAASYLGEAFAPMDRLAVVLINKQQGQVIQRLASAEAIAAVDFQQCLAEKNNARYDVYLSMNPLHATAQGRTKRDVGCIRHLYLDFDMDGTAAVSRLLQRDDLPTPNYIVSSSPGKWHVIWNVEGFSKEQAEALQRGLARESGADPAATDCSRVLRLPGFYNHKYVDPYAVTVERYATQVRTRAQFPLFLERVSVPRTVAAKQNWSPVGRPSQSERDWAYAKRALARGQSPTMVIAAIAQYRRCEKHDPVYYAEITVRDAVAALHAPSVREDGRERP